MNGARLRGVIFDMDGVLVDSHAVHREAWSIFFRSLGREVPDSELDFVLDGRKRREILLHFLGECAGPELEALGRRKDRIFRQMQVAVNPVPGVVRMTRELHAGGAALAVATSGSRDRARFTLKELGLQDCFQVVVTGEDVRLGKPDAAIYRLACSHLGLEAACLLAVEDAISGIRAAVGAGLQCVGVALHEKPEKLAAAGAVPVVPHFEGIGAQDLENMLMAKGADDS